ncbi:hypothetical protein SAMN05421831_11112 [Allopseudospirillum japonicum]|uniref:Uncharacterized protein n=1 Tax=Allopseudospirillum japonicum TaxID=64971 RepID=A0A1H6TPV7_9GAMM|nr:DUF6776 family protein [Allopseudospirillum japonicum]SEI81306.1 hypothetical protein SAMN05421831_11112 [Allopseudospirillum japonicum]
MSFGKARSQKKLDDTLVIVPKRQRSPWKTVLLVLILLALSAGASYWAGHWQVWRKQHGAVEERDQLRVEVQVKEKQLQDLRRKLAIVESGNDIDRKAYQELQQASAELNARIAQLENEVAFYKRVMDPDNVDKGLRVARWELAATTDAKVFDYKLVISQVADNNNYIEGLALVNLVGRQGTTPNVVIPLKDVSEEVQELGIKFRFRFFQNVTGQIRLPDDFVAERVQVILQSTGSKAMRVEKYFDWTTQEAE